MIHFRFLIVFFIGLFFVEFCLFVCWFFFTFFFAYDHLVTGINFYTQKLFHSLEIKGTPKIDLIWLMQSQSFQLYQESEFTIF